MSWPEWKSKINLVGHRFGHLLVQREAPKLSKEQNKANNYRRYWICLCDCGVVCLSEQSQLRSGHKISCGCYHRKLIKSGFINRRHGLTGTGTFNSWAGMIGRCTNPNHIAYKNYGGRGITVSDDLKIFSNFLEYLGKRPKGMNLGRIDNDKGYFRDNIRWETTKQNARNTRATRWLTIDGITKSASEWCEIYNVPWSRVKVRLMHGWNHKDALTLPKRINQFC